MVRITNFAGVEKALSQYVLPARRMRGAYNLDAMRSLMEQLGNPQDSYKVIHVAGTSGKTSTAYYIASLLHESGKKVGLTVSPHIENINERVQIGAQPLSEAEFCKAFSEFMDVLSKIDIQPTYFELMAAFAFWQFAQAKVDYAVVEVGLGGLLDATNVVTRSDKVSVITDIGYDHQDILGETLTEIAGQKAGILLPQSVAICLEQPEEVGESFAEAAQKHHATLQVLKQKDLEFTGPLPLYQRRNWFLANAVVGYVLQRDGEPALTKEQQVTSLATQIPARMETIQQGNKILIMDAAHNPQKMQALIPSLQNLYPKKKFVVLLALLEDRDYRVEGVLDELLPIASKLIVTQFVSGQDLRKYSMSAERIAEVCESKGFNNVEVVEDTEAALNTLLNQDNEQCLITGSIYLIHDVKQILKRIA